jgi:NAD(P)-dependent dehydrogenase (short-subunit alcohol dehydrogenase family)
MMKGLEGKRVLVTGGASGIGEAAAWRFLDEGAEVIVMDCDESGCQRLGDESQGRLGTFSVDVSDPEQVAGAFAKLDRVWDRLDIVINNAGISIRHPLLEITPAEWSRVVSVDLNGVFFVAQASARRMVQTGGGCILNMGSTNALVGYRYYADYNSAKAGVVELTRSMALELAPLVRVNAVCPGYVLTPMQEAEYTPKMMQEVNSKIPLGRHAKPEEIAALFAFLASEEAQYITGQTIVIDGEAQYITGQTIVIDGGETAGGLASR